jgi:DNA helicase HerA-like ATPase
LLKQARAFGVGVVLATQNPVDLDYKGAVEHRHRGSLGKAPDERDKAACSTGLESLTSGSRPPGSGRNALEA